MNDNDYAIFYYSLQRKEMIRKIMTKLFVDYDIRKKQLEERETTEK